VVILLSFMKFNDSPANRVHLLSSLSKPLPRELLILFVLALLFRLLAALPQQQPNYMDAAYSYVNALNLAVGRGFVEDFVWNYLGQPGLPPHPSHLYWMPLTSILAWLGMAVGGTSYRAAQMPFILLSALLAPISYQVTYQLSSQRWLGWLAGLLAIFSGFYFPYWTAIDNFTPFAITGSLALLTAWRGIGDEVGSKQNNEGKFDLQSPLWLFTAGIFAGLAHLARADGPLLLISIVLLYILRLSAQPPLGTPQCAASPSPLAHPLGVWDASVRSLPLGRFTLYASRLTLHASRFTLPLLLGYILIITPWFIRNWQVAGTALPVAGSQTIWLTTSNDLFSSYANFFSYKSELSAQTFFTQDIGSILQGRWWVLIANLQTVLAAWGMIFLLPFVLVGAWQLRHQFLMQLAGLYTLLLFVTMTLIFAFPGALGGLFHSGAALLPFIYAAALIGLDRAVDWVARHRRRWDAPLAKQFFGVGLVIMAVTLSSFVYYGRVLKNNAWNNADTLYPAIAAWVAKENQSATVMIGNPPAYRYHGGGLSIIVPNENIETTLQAARHYEADYLILDQNHPAPLTEVYTQTVTHPSLSLVQTFTDDAGHDIYIFKIIRP
jgi:hypothetical protein